MSAISIIVPVYNVEKYLPKCLDSLVNQTIKNNEMLLNKNSEIEKECILKYWNNPNLVVEHGKKGYEKVLTNYTEDIYFKKLIKLYEEILNDSQKHNN